MSSRDCRYIHDLCGHTDVEGVTFSEHTRHSEWTALVFAIYLEGERQEVAWKNPKEAHLYKTLHQVPALHRDVLFLHWESCRPVPEVCGTLCLRGPARLTHTLREIGL
jgi:hypothetical protein